MVDKKDDDSLSRSDFDTIMEVNKKSIEIQIEVSDQNEKIIEYLDENEEALKNLKLGLDEIDKKLFKIELFLATGVVSLVWQVIQFVMSKR